MQNSKIKDVIEYGKRASLTTDDLSLKTIVTNSLDEKFVVNMNCLFEKYYELLTDYAVTVTLTEEEYFRYRFKPRLLSKDLYGTTILKSSKLTFSNSVIF